MSEQEEQLVDKQEPSWVDFISPVSAVSGFSLTVYGAAQIYEPIGFIIAGVLLLALAVKGAQE